MIMYPIKAIKRDVVDNGNEWIASCSDTTSANIIANALNDMNKRNLCDHKINKILPEVLYIVRVGENTCVDTWYCRQCKRVLYTEYSDGNKYIVKEIKPEL